MATDTRLAGAQGLEGVSTHLVRYEGEEIRGDAAKELLIRLAGQPDVWATDG